ncbi:MAG: DUF1735 domain-containing protein [Mucilaginibacter sp.]|jgi:hypothetical protein|uniref:DUF1735 domain-containing protein n=1 Tax=Mucilaginibacter sp. TaxID=1882438 RepID=UPI0035650FD3
MKKYFSIILFTAAVGFTGCLKDNKTNLTPNNSPAVVEWSTAVTGDAPISPSGSTFPLYLRSLEINPSIDLTFEVNYTGGEAAPEDITVNFGIDNTALTQYNQERLDRDHETVNLEPMPTSWYSIEGTSVVIKKGERKGVIKGKVNTTNITDFNKQYVVALKITSVSRGTISGNYGTILMQIGAKNPYDGTYTHTYTSTLGNGTNTLDLVTTGANTVALDPGLLGVYSNAQTLTIDPATNNVTVSMSSLLPIGNTGPSTWDPATKTFHVKWTSNGGARTFDETYVFKSPRN